MKRCPKCRRDYYDDTLLYCLDDGSALLEGPASAGTNDGPPTAILHDTRSSDEAATLAHTHKIGAESRALAAKKQDEARCSTRPALGPLLAGIVAVAALIGGFFGYRYFKSSDSTPIDSIAVLPFENKSSNADTEYLSDGLPDSLIYRLSQLPNLKVSPTSSVMRFKGKTTDTLQIAKDLNVDAVMSGRLVQVGENLNISVQLTDARTDKLIWAEQYDRKMADLLATQREIATAIVDKLQLKLSGGEQPGIIKNYTDSSEAYQSYLRGRHFLGKRNMENLQKAVAEFEAAVSKDPKFALAFVGLSEAKAVMPFYSNAGADESMREAKAYAQRALQIDDSLGEAHSSLGYAEMYLWNWDAAEKELKRGIELNPNYSIAHKFYGNYLSNLGRFEEAAAALRRAHELEPLSLIINVNLGDAYLERGDLDAAAQQFQKAVDLDPNWHVSRRHLALAYLKQGRNSDAVTESEKSVDLSKRQSVTLGFMGYVYSQVGKRDAALRLIEELQERYKSGQANGYDIARIYVGIDDEDAVFEWLEKDFKSRNAIMVAWLYLTPFDKIHDDPRFIELTRRLGMFTSAKKEL